MSKLQKVQAYHKAAQSHYPERKHRGHLKQPNLSKVRRSH
jgi:hypothetical protein